GPRLNRPGPGDLTLDRTWPAFDDDLSWSAPKAREVRHEQTTAGAVQPGGHREPGRGGRGPGRRGLVPQRGAAQADEGTDAAVRLPGRARHHHLVRADAHLRRAGQRPVDRVEQLVGRAVLPGLRRAVRVDLGLT